MPPGSRLTNEQIDLIRRWIDEGAVWPEEGAAKRRPGWDHWAFQVPRRPTAPKVRNSAWVRNEIDTFILSRLEAEHIQPSPEADRNTLLRRVSLDLTGLPPAPTEIEDFLADKSANAYEKVVDRLLASPHYGERWGRHWLDLARYADSDGYTIDGPRQIWKYRDWVIDALNRDMPFDQFTIEQIAGDLLSNPTAEQLIATGFHRNTPSNYEGGIDFEQYRVEAVADRVAATGAVFLGLTTGCARCHDHKYDPISQREFYQLFAYFNNTDEITSEDERYDFNRPVLELPTHEQLARREAYNAQVAQLSRELTAYVRKLAKVVAELLHEMEYSLQANRKTKEGGGHPDRDAQFAHINTRVQMAEDAEGARGVTETTGDVGRGLLIDEEGTEGFVLALHRELRRKEEILVAWCRYLIRSAGLHT
jgi:hypothetical protein